MRHLLSLFDLTNAEVETLITQAMELKQELRSGSRLPRLEHKVIALLFEKPSLRTRVSFETGVRQMGGSALFLGNESGFGRREPMKDFAQVLSGFVDGIVCRAKSHRTVEELAEFSRVPVINGLTDLYHPCQALADLQTFRERFEDWQGRKICYLGDTNNVSASLAIGCAKLGIELVIGCPEPYRFESSFADRFEQEFPGHEINLCNDPKQAAQNASMIYTDVWASMGQEAEAAERVKDFASFQVNEDIMQIADPDAIFMHCLPAIRGQEVSESVIDGPASAVYDQAENRMHAQKSLLLWLLGDG